MYPLVNSILVTDYNLHKYSTVTQTAVEQLQKVTLVNHVWPHKRQLKHCYGYFAYFLLVTPNALSNEVVALRVRAPHWSLEPAEFIQL